MLKINKTYTIILSISLGLFFIISGVGKMVDASSFEVLIKNYGLGRLSILAPIIIILEIYLGLNLVLLSNIKKTSISLLVLLVVFTVAFSYAFFFNGITDCGCFGKLNTSGIPSSLTFLRNIFLLILLIVLLINQSNIVNSPTSWKPNMICVIISISSFIIGNTFEKISINSSMKGKSDPISLIGKSIYDTPVQSISLNTKSQLIFILSPSCPHCLNSIENIKKIFENHIVDSSAVYISSRTNYDSLNFMGSTFFVNWSDTITLEKITTLYPTTIYIKNDTIKDVILGVVPSYLNLNKIIY